MSAHLPILPVLLPLLAGILLLALSDMDIRIQRRVNLIATGLLVLLAGWLVVLTAEIPFHVYALGDWRPPFGIVLVVDRLSAIMLAATALLALAVTGYVYAKDDYHGDNFYALFQFQLLGLNGAFLTGDLFNLFVFFEILLISSYALLVYGAGRERVMAGLHYVVINLVGSAFFLIAVGTLYALLGTLNIADLARSMVDLPASDQALARAAGLLLLVVFAIKAALLPLGFWLPAAYGSAAAPVAALFAIMTKVGVYGILRVHGTLFGEQAGELAGLGNTLLWWLGLATLLLSMIAVLAGRHLRGVLVWLVIFSVGVMMTGIAQADVQVLTAVLYYLLHSTWVIAALFLLAGCVVAWRGDAADYYVVGLRPGKRLGLLFMVGAVAVIGLPPLSGFVSKVLLLQAVGAGWAMLPLWVLLLVGGLLTLVALSRAGSSLFWRGEAGEPLRRLPVWPVALLLLASIVMAFAAAPVLDYLEGAAQQILHPVGYIDAVLGSEVRDAN